MKRLVPALLMLVSLATSAQTLYLYPPASSLPAGGYQTLTAIVNGVNNKGVTWTTTGGTLIGQNPCTNNGPCTIALHSATSGGPYTVTATTAVGSVTATSAITFTSSPTPASTHPRLIITAAMLPGLQAKATSGNPMYQAMRNAAIANYTTDNANWSWTCNSGTGLPSSPQVNNGEEGHAYLYSYMALVDPSDPTYNWGCYGHDVWTYVMAQVVAGNQTLVGNAWSDSSLFYAVTTDWLIGAGALTSSTDLNNARTFMAFVLRTILNYGYGSTAPYDNWNNYQQFVTGTNEDLVGERAMGNNYTFSKLLYLVSYSLTFNDNSTDDPPLTGAANTCGASRYVLCSDFTGGSLHAYWSYFAGGMLLKENAHLEDPTVAQEEYNAAYPSGGFSTEPNCLYDDSAGTYYPCFGDGRDGESSEGSWYQYSLWRLRYALNMMDSAGYNDPLLWGPQVSLDTSSWWDMKLISDREFLTGFGANGNSIAPAYNYFTTGDSNAYVRTPADMITEASMLTADSYTGRTDRTDAELWMVLNTAYGGPKGTSGGCTYYCGYVAELPTSAAFATALDLFITQPAADPTTTLPTDPASGYPLDWWNPSYNQHQIVRSRWSTSGVTLGIYGANTLIDHEQEYQGGFDLYSDLEYITKGRTEFTDYNQAMSTGQFRNAGAYANTPNSGYSECPEMEYAGEYGGQFWHSEQQGLTTALHSELPAYAAYSVNQLPTYNGCFEDSTMSYNGVTAASRDLLYLRGANQLIYYDRVATSEAAAKALYLNTTGSPTISGATAHWLTRSGDQKANYTALLPSGVTVGNVPLVNEVTTAAPYGNLQSGTSMQATCTGTLASGGSADYTSTAVWASNTPSVASVSSTGLVSGVSVGTAAIFCFVDGIQAYGSMAVVSGASGGTWANTTSNTQAADWEPYTSLEASAGSPTATQFLSTLEWGASTFTPTTATLVQSTAGQGFDGALMGSSLVLFMRSVATFTGVTYPASGATTHYLSDLTPNTTYPITGAGTPSTAASDNAGILTFSATGTGNITVGTPVVATVSSSFSGGMLLSGGASVH